MAPVIHRPPRPGGGAPRFRGDHRTRGARRSRGVLVARFPVVVLALSVSAAFVACGSNTSSTDDPASSGSASTMAYAAPPTFDVSSGSVTALDIEVLNTHPHDPEAYTQGLVYAGVDRLYETTGRYGHSSLREVTIESGMVTRRADLDDAYFGEGLALSAGRLIALTWKEQTALAFDPASFEQTGSYTYDGVGWGLCDDGERLVMSDGTSTLTFRDQQSFEPIGSVEVTLGGEPLTLLNELECVDGLVYANVYLTSRIVVIDPASGRVVATADADGLLDAATAAGLEHDEVLNGIAFNPDLGVFYLTGKNWPDLFIVRFVTPP